MAKAEVINFMYKYVAVLLLGIIIFFLYGGFRGAYGFLLVFTILAMLWVLVGGD